MRHKKPFIIILMTIILLSILLIRNYIVFSRSDLDSPLISAGEPGGMAESGRGRETDYEMLSRENIYVSKVYLMEGSSRFQIRFRMAYGIPFRHGEMMNEMSLMIEDDVGNSCGGIVTVYGESRAGMECVNVAWTSEEALAEWSGREIVVTAVFSEERTAVSEDGYAHCVIKISLKQENFP